MNSEILLSICIATYNRCDILCENVDKLLKYKGNDIEIVIVDNASTDGTWEAIQLLSDKRVRVFRNNVNKGANFNWIRSLLLGRGEYRMLLNDRDSMDVMKMETFLRFLRNNESNGEVIVALDGIRKVSKSWERAFLLSKDSHPSNYVYSASVIDRVASVLDKEIMEGIKEFDERQYNISMYFQMVIFQFENWCSYPEQIATLMSPEKKKKIQQQRFDPIHGDPWYAPEVRVKWIDEHTFMCKQLRNFALWRGFYRADLRIVLEIFYDENKRKSFSYWIKMPSFFAKETKKILKKYDAWNSCKYDLFCETLSGYILLLWQLSYRFYRKYIMHGSEYW